MSSDNYLLLFLADANVFYFIFAEAAAALQQRLGELETELRAKGLERSQAAQECERLNKELADQAERHKVEVQQHKAEIQQLKDGEDLLKAEFETQRSN